MKDISRKNANLILFAVAIVWGAGFIFNQVLFDAGYTPLQILTVRFFIGASILTIIFRKSLKEIKKQDLIGSFFIGITLFIAFIFQLYGQQLTTPSVNAFITATYVIFVPIMSFVFFKISITYHTIVAAVFAFLGIVLITLQPSQNSFDSRLMGIGIILTFISALCFALQIIFVEHYTKKINPIVVTIFMFWTAFICSLVVTAIMLIVQKDLPVVESKREIVFLITNVVSLGIFSTGLAFLGQNVGQKFTTASNAVIILSMESVFAAIFSNLILKEKFTITMVTGFVIVLSAVLIAELKPEFRIFKIKTK